MIDANEIAVPFTLVTHKMSRRERSNGLYHVAADLIQGKIDEDLATHPTIQSVLEQLKQFRSNIFIRRGTEHQAFIFTLKSIENPLFMGYPCEEEHLTVDAIYVRKNNSLSCAHYKLIIQTEATRLIIRYYINHKGELLELSVKSDAEEKKLDEDNPLYLGIRAHINERMRPFHTMLLGLISAKSLLIFNLSQKALEEQESFAQTQIATTTHFNQQQRKQLISNIQTLIQRIALRNRYDDDEQDTRSQQWETLLSILQTQPEKKLELSSSSHTVQISTETVDEQPIDNESITTDAKIKKPNSHRPQAKIVVLVDKILALQASSDLKEYELFIQQPALLNELEIEYSSLLWSEKPSHKALVAQQKCRLGFTQFNLDDYFFHKLLSGDVETVEHLLPHLSKAKKYGFYDRLLTKIELDTAPFSHELLVMAGFLYEHDSIYLEVFHLWQYDKMHEVLCETSTSPVYKKSLAYMCATNNIEGFRLFVEQRYDLRQAQIISQEYQLHSLDACIIISGRTHNNPEFVRVLLAHDIKVTDTTITVSWEHIRPSKRKIMLGTQSVDTLTVPFRSESARDNSLVLAIQSTPSISNIELIKILIEHSDLETLAMACARSLVANNDFSSRFHFASTNTIKIAENTDERDLLTIETRARLGTPLGFAYIFCPSSAEIEALPKKIAMFREILSCFIQHCCITSDTDKRILSADLLQQAQHMQKNQERNVQIRTLATLDAAVFVWGQIADRTLDDCTQILRILYLKSIVQARVHALLPRRTELMLSLYQAAIQFADYYPDETIRKALKQTSIYKMLKTNAEQSVSAPSLQTLSVFVTNTSAIAAAQQEIVEHQSSAKKSKTRIKNK